MREGRVIKKFDVSKKLEVNQQVECELLGGKYEGEYSIKVADISDDQNFIVNAPYIKGHPIKLAVNTRFNIKLKDDNGIYILPVKVTGRQFDATELLSVKLREPVTKIQERQFFRLEVYKNLNYRLIANNQEDLEAKGGIDEIIAGEVNELPAFDKEGKVRDMSAGGLKLFTAERLGLNQIIEIEINFINASFNTVCGEVVRVDKQDAETEEIYEVGIEFIECRRRQRDQITKWLFDKQRELRQKGLL
ncbi:putative glycosyltransferase [Halobacteroides halobius DSM 5150]|uniref:Putative glycosyltransferase n=1 Tax=Halobacteroides halobius (strain ATCC 35273 / DSM 5150 / MD-1) TaxID=748449 RepID=L0K8F2_HALHC|nr:flagellar brake protein [Halobacteroides halobius]AGB40649.1 putative glycosyltransferase [Halobacteroides halobius DSM 5150]